ncbi:MAG: ABC transporter ATP-binding protein [Promethearchaeia archaeon]
MKNNLEEDEDLADLNVLLREDVLVLGDHLIKDYEIGDYVVRAVDDVSFEIEEGEFIGIIGPSGAGKTTFLNLIGGLDFPTKGKLYLFGVKITDMDAESLATWRAIHSGFVFQNYNLISTLTAVENIIFPMKIIGESLDKSRERAVTLLEKMNLTERYEHLPFQLSAGEQQRVAIARALANDPPLLIADEPTANLDKETSNFIETIFKDLKKHKKTIVVATHDEYLIELADRIFTFEDGKIIDIN